MAQDPQDLSDLFEILSIPSISTLPENKEDMRRVITWVTNYLTKNGFAAENIKQLYADGFAWETHHPVLYAERIDNPANKTILIYGHYDVQPVDPIDQWQSQPFSPEVRDGYIYARGATDDKGQMFTHLVALSQLAKEWGSNWPVNVKIILEGEEEMGGENVAHILKDSNYQELLKADVALISDSGFISDDQPSLEYGLRGIAYMQIDVKLSDRDLHSGLYGGGVRNPANALAQILAKLQDPETGKVLIPGFYDRVVDVSEQERAALAKLPYADDTFLAEAGNAKGVFGEVGYTTMERTSARPTLDINGIWGGFSGVGAKTIIPAEAHAKVSMRLVADQQPAEIAKLFTDYVTQVAPSGVEVKVQFIHDGDGILIDINSPYIQKAASALSQIWGKEAMFGRSGGSIPIAALIKSKLGIDPVLMGYGQPGDALHSPNERFSVDQFYKGIECNKLFYKSCIE